MYTEFAVVKTAKGRIVIITLTHLCPSDVLLFTGSYRECLDYVRTPVEVE